MNPTFSFYMVCQTNFGSRSKILILLEAETEGQMAIRISQCSPILSAFWIKSTSPEVRS